MQQAGWSLADLVDWFDTWKWWLLGGSALVFVVSLLVIPVIVVYLPDDYFVRPRRPFAKRGLWALPGLIVKNMIGTLLLTAGIIMIFTPGQGLLSIVVGFALLDFPGKRSLERRLIGRPVILKTVNALRRKAGRNPLILKKPE